LKKNKEYIPHCIHFQMHVSRSQFPGTSPFSLKETCFRGLALSPCMHNSYLVVRVFNVFWLIVRFLCSLFDSYESYDTDLFAYNVQSGRKTLITERKQNVNFSVNSNAPFLRFSQIVSIRNSLIVQSKLMYINFAFMH